MTAAIKLQTAMEYAFAHQIEGAGFPYLAECLRQAGVTHNIWSLPAAQSMYLLEGEWIVNQGVPLFTAMVAVPAFNQEKLVEALRSNQAGDSTFPEFLQAIWESGVVGYDVEFAKHTVTYMGSMGELYTETYPAVEVTGLYFETTQEQF